MNIAANKAVLMHYTLKNDQGEVLDSSAGHDPLAYLHGAGNIIPGLEKQLEGKVKGDKVTHCTTSRSVRRIQRSQRSHGI